MARTVLVIDCGSRAVRAYVAEVGPRSEIRILERLERPVDLSASQSGERLTRSVMDDCVLAFRDIVQAAAAYGVEASRAVASAALADAGNSDILVERVRHECGVALELIDVAEQARLYNEALGRLLTAVGDARRGTTLMVDVGSGSSVVGVIRARRLVYAVEEHFGANRVYAGIGALRDHVEFTRAIERLTHGSVSMMLGRLPRCRITRVVVAGAQPRRLLALLGADTNADLVNLTTEQIDRWWQGVASLLPPGRAQRCGGSIAEADQLLLVVAFLRHLIGQLGVVQVVIPRLRMCDGLLADFMPGALGPHHLGRNQLLAEAREISRLYAMPRVYAENTARLAGQIFDQTLDLHGLGDRARALLEFAALVHDIGAFINVRSRHKHSFYILMARDIAGLTADEKAVLALVVRYHRRSPPEPSHAEFQALSREQRVLVASLAGILRIAYALDIER
ncbi:MAG: Ppx/GppA phosphatase family protein, partial [Planctomycetota bacterium]